MNYFFLILLTISFFILWFVIGIIFDYLSEHTKNKRLSKIYKKISKFLLELDPTFP
jgi:preprotein translocase subunit SecG